MKIEFRIAMLVVSTPLLPIDHMEALREYLVREFARAMQGTLLDGMPVVFVPQGVSVSAVIASESHEINPPPDPGPRLESGSIRSGEGTT